MSQTVKARKALISLGEVPLEVYQMPDGSYQLYSASIMAVIGEDPNGKSYRQFLAGKSPEVLPHKDLNDRQVKPILVEGQANSIKPVPVEVAVSYWMYKHRKGNQQAGAIISACINESIERRADAVFGVDRTEEQRQERFAQHLSPEAIAEQQKTDKQIRLAELQVELAKTQERLVARSEAIATLHGVGTLALILGNPSAVIEKTETIEKTVCVDPSGKRIASFDGVGITYLTKRFGFKTNKQTWAWLESIGYGKSSEHWVQEIIPTQSSRIPRHFLEKLDRLWAIQQGTRQKLIGEL
ncbi:MAG: hypothetical protein F6J93_37695 [Oscillatoria sp. SIO1A7]|nr:hypothetical protein [Oscillatoria sp. SIO1A7]